MSSQSLRDEGATFRLMAAALSLQEFTAKELSSHANSKDDTADDFIKRRIDKGIFEEIPLNDLGPLASLLKGKRGRKPSRFRIAGNIGKEAFARFGEVRKLFQTPAYQASDIGRLAYDQNGALAMLERTLSSIIVTENLTPENRSARLERAKFLCAEAVKDAIILASSNNEQERTMHFGLRLGAAQSKLEELESSLQPWRSMVDKMLIDYGGGWTGAIANNPLINKIIFVLVGSLEQTAYISRFKQFWQANSVAVAQIPVTSYAVSDWEKLNKSLYSFEVAAPGAVGGVCLTISGGDTSSHTAFRDFIYRPEIELSKKSISQAPLLTCINAGDDTEIQSACKAVGINFVSTGGHLFDTLKTRDDYIM